MSLGRRATSGNVWGEIGERYAQAPAPQADAVSVDNIRWGDRVPVELDVGFGNLAALPADRPAFFSAEQQITIVNKMAERDWRLAIALEWPNPFEGLLAGDSVAALQLHAVFRVQYGLGVFSSQVLLGPYPVSAIDYELPPAGNIPGALFPDIGTPGFVQLIAPYVGSQGVNIYLNDPSEFRLSVFRGASVKSVGMFDIPSANMVISAYVYATTLPDGLSFEDDAVNPNPRTFHALLSAGLAPWTRGSKL